MKIFKVIIKALKLNNILILGGLLVISACAPIDPPQLMCNELPSNVEIQQFTVEVTTGEEESDADIYFCIVFSGTMSDHCELLDEDFTDDFNAGSTGIYSFPFTIPSQQVTGFYLKNGGGASAFSFDGNDWQIVALRVIVGTNTGSITLVDSRLDFILEAGQEYDPGCKF